MGLSLSLRLSHHVLHISDTGYPSLLSGYGDDRSLGWSDPLPQLHLWEVHHQDSVDRGEHHLRGGVTEGDDEVHRVVQADQLQGDEDDLPEVLRGQQGPLQVQERGHLYSEDKGRKPKAYCKRNKPNDRYPAIS